MEDNTESRESKKKSREDNTRSSESKEERRKSMEDNTRPTESESESEEDILDEDDEKADKEHDQKLESPVQPVGLSAVPRSRAPSFFRKARPRKPREMINHHVGATITSQSMPGQNIVLVRPRTLGQTNPKEHNGLVPMEGDEEIFEEQAVCKFCSGILKEENILKTECDCGNALTHEGCATIWSIMRGDNCCDFCNHEVQTFPVALVRWLSSSTQMVGREENNKWSLSSWLMRIWKA